MNTRRSNNTASSALRLRLAAFAIAGIVTVGVTTLTVTTPVRAQNATPAVDDTKKISLTFTQAPVENVLKTLFASEGLNYTIDQDVQGNVSVDINNVSFDTALHSLMRATNPELEYTIEPGNVYHIRVKRTAAASGDQGSGAQPTEVATTGTQYNLYKIPIDRYDATEIATFLSNKATTVNVGPNFTVSSGGAGGTGGRGGIGGGGIGGGGIGGGTGGGFGGGIGGSTGGGVGGGMGGYR